MTKKRRIESDSQSLGKYEHLRHNQCCLLAKVVDRSWRKIIKCKGTITIKGHCNDNHENLKVIMWFIMVFCNQMQHYFCCLKIIIKNVCQILTPPPPPLYTVFFSCFHVFLILIIQNITYHNCTCWISQGAYTWSLWASLFYLMYTMILQSVPQRKTK